MDSDRSDFGKTSGEEPALTQKNSQTIIGEDTLASDGTTAESNLDTETSTRTRSGAIPSSYGASGGTTDAYEEGAGQADADAQQVGADGAGI